MVIREMKSKNIIGLLILLLMVMAVLSVFIGAVWISPLRLLSGQNPDILRLRIVRTILAFIAGAGLSAAGVILQGLLRNPLAEPCVLGISSGAGLGAASCIVLGLSSGALGLGFLPLMAFLGALLTMILVYNLAKTNGKISIYNLLLSGVIVSAVLSAILIFMVSISTREGLHSILWWLLGSLQQFDLKLVIVTGVIVTACLSASLIFWRDLNIITLGEEPAIHLGLRVEAIKKILFILASLLTAGVVSVCGLIGFVGLIVPHLMRILLGPNHKFLLPSSIIGGGLFLITCDLLSRTLLSPVEIPIGVITALIGGPLFITLLRRKRG
ncbi:MAG: iron ABC transporter permease [Candidatus Omnitrophota bacterium]|nr:iron ABC transporter permease [Candidatus Omnitrophota bacterium]